MLVGSGEFKEDYKKKLAGLQNVTLGPKIPSEQVPTFLSLCDILYLSTRPSKVWEYGQSMNKMIEYMLAGKPIIASYSGYQSMLNEASCGIFIKLGE